jgi:hypothetical protein
MMFGESQSKTLNGDKDSKCVANNLLFQLVEKEIPYPRIKGGEEELCSLLVALGVI